MSSERPVAAQYVVTFLKPEMLHLYRQITGLREFRPFVFCQKRENPDEFPFDDVVIVPKPRSHQFRRFWQRTMLRRPITIYRSEARRLLAALVEAETRILHIYFGHIGIYLLPLLELLHARNKSGSHAARIPAIVSFHGADAGVGLDAASHRRALQRMIELADVLLVRSESLGQRLREYGAPPEKICLHRTGIPLDQIRFAQRTAPADGKWQLLQACRLIPKKGLATSLRAFADFTRSWPEARFTIAGEGPQLSALRGLAQELGISERVQFRGFVQQAELRMLEKEAHIFIHPSERGPDGDQEGIPNSILEAMASGLPVVSTTHGGIPEAVDENLTGYLVPERDHAALADALLRVSKDSEAFARMSAASSGKAAAEFDISVQSRRLEEIYRRLLSA